MDKFANVIDASPETILCGGHIRTSDATAFSTCKSLDLNFSRCATKVSSCYLLVEDKQRSSAVNRLSAHIYTEAQRNAEIRRDTTDYRDFQPTEARYEILTASSRTHRVRHHLRQPADNKDQS